MSKVVEQFLSSSITPQVESSCIVELKEHKLWNMDQSNDHNPWTLIGMAIHGVPTSYLYSTFVSQDLVGIFD